MKPVRDGWSWLLVLAAGFALAALWGGLWLGGAMALGRTDSALAIPTLLTCALGFAALAVPHMVARPWLAGGTALAALTLAVLVRGGEGQWSLHFLAGAAFSLALALFVVARTADWQRAVRWGALASLAAVWWLASHVVLGKAYAVQAPPESRKTLILTGLPLQSWSSGRTAFNGPQDSAALAALRSRVAPSLVFADGLAAGSVGPDDRLLLAHPFALPPETLVEIDRAVQAGSKAVILADGLSSWPASYPLGDPRNPPVTSLLTPLLDHWGVRLDAPLVGSATSGAVIVDHTGHRLMLHSPGHFAQLPRNCRAAGRSQNGQPTIATCRIGRGTVVLIADADMLFDPLWRPEPLWAAHLRLSDNIEWLAEQLDGPSQRSFWGIRSTWAERAAE